MVKWHLRSRRGPTGKLIRRLRKKRKMDRGSEFIETRLDVKKRVKVTRTRGGNVKLNLLTVNEINVADPKTKKIRKLKIITVEKNPANPHYVRMNVITKGAIVKTEIGSVRVTSKPGQHGVVNGVLIEEKK
ncbi:MAG: 30S ribosomal protein S8e [Candidatus Aenigmarchaeota archaeon]|nr:30S ribosomal protein S8e [Candidatus Aenigmarchaeota archaeon]